MHVDSYLTHSKENPKTDAPASEEEEELDEFEKNPWNAAVVVGLRVYHKVPDQKSSDVVVKLRVVRPHLLVDDDEDVGDSEKERKSTGLDVDDSAKDATLEGGIKERKKSIMGDTLNTRG